MAYTTQFTLHARTSVLDFQGTCSKGVDDTEGLRENRLGGLELGTALDDVGVLLKERTGRPGCRVVVQFQVRTESL